MSRMTIAGLIVAATVGNSPAPAQGLLAVEVGSDGKVRSAPAKTGDQGPVSLSDADSRRVATVQRMLARLGYMREAQVSRTLDDTTLDAVAQFSRTAKLTNPDILSENFLRALFLAVWSKDNWSAGQADGLDLVVDKTLVRTAQIALRDLGYAPGPSDGVFGPGTFTAIEVFQEERGMRVNGLLTTNIFDAINRAAANRDIDYRGDVRVLNWADYINPESLLQFERDHELRVVYEVFGSLDEADELLASASTPYDLFVRSGLGIRDMVEQDLVQSINTLSLENFDGIDPEINKITTNWDPTNSYVVPYMWGITGVVADMDKVTERLGRPVYGWDLILDPRNAKKLADCGIIMVDGANDVLTGMIGAVDPAEKDLSRDTITDLSDKIAAIAPYVEIVDSERFIDRIAKQEVCVAVGYSGDAMQALGQVKSKSPALTFFVPEEGSIIWFDYFMMSRDATNSDAALAFMDFLLEPEIAGQNTNYVQYANAVTGSAQFIDKALLENPALYPPQSVISQLRVVNPLDSALQRQVDQAWDRLKQR